jgi:hypothetical protein
VDINVLRQCLISDMKSGLPEGAGKHTSTVPTVLIAASCSVRFVVRQAMPVYTL